MYHSMYTKVFHLTSCNSQHIIYIRTISQVNKNRVLPQTLVAIFLKRKPVASCVICRPTLTYYMRFNHVFIRLFIVDDVSADETDKVRFR
jgi:hypothetical protein